MHLCFSTIRVRVISKQSHYRRYDCIVTYLVPKLRAKQKTKFIWLDWIYDNATELGYIILNGTENRIEDYICLLDLNLWQRYWAELHHFGWKWKLNGWLHLSSWPRSMTMLLRWAVSFILKSLSLVFKINHKN